MSSTGIAIVGNQLWMGKRHDGASGTWIHSGSASAVGRGDWTAPKTSSEFQNTEGPSGIQGILERLCFHDRGPGDPSEMRAIRIRIDRGSWNRYLPRRNSSSHRSVVLGGEGKGGRRREEVSLRSENKVLPTFDTLPTSGKRNAQSLHPFTLLISHMFLCDKIGRAHV